MPRGRGFTQLDTNEHCGRRPVGARMCNQIIVKSFGLPPNSHPNIALQNQNLINLRQDGCIQQPACASLDLPGSVITCDQDRGPFGRAAATEAEITTRLQPPSCAQRTGPGYWHGGSSPLQMLVWRGNGRRRVPCVPAAVSNRRCLRLYSRHHQSGRVPAKFAVPVVGEVRNGPQPSRCRGGRDGG